MMISPHQACYFAHELTRLGSVGELDRLSTTLFDSKVDLNPHQIEAALFALSNPLQKGVILADEVGLGKTIEAGLVLCQRWAERKRKLIVVCPAHIRKQWQIELMEKFSLPSIVIERKAYNQLLKEGVPNPFDCGKIVVVSYSFASRMKEELRATHFDLVVFDEAHKLRNAYQPSRKGGQAIRWAFELRQKILLTATPLQNTLLELYGLGWIIGDHIFGDRSAFQSRYCNAGGNIQELRERLSQFCIRSLRRDCAYINYTKRKAITHPFEQTAAEKKLYNDVVEFMNRDISFAFPQRQRHLMEIILFKHLASSPQALASTLSTMRRRVQAIRDGIEEREDDSYLDEFASSEDIDIDALVDLLESDELESIDQPAIQGRLVANELESLDDLIQRAESITTDSKSKSLLGALSKAFNRLEEVRANQKALIFTESRKTQAFLASYLEANGYEGKVVMFNGANSHPTAKKAYERYVKKHAGTDKLSGSKPVDIRSALIEEFRDNGQIMLATEAAAEGVNLQFCSLVVNYDLPWNPQRIEQRIGRCHRYGQKHDVIVVNFLSKDNRADQRVHDLLNQKFHLFDGLFGVSDDVLGAIEDGIDFESRVLQILKSCRSDDQIEKAFNKLQRELEEVITTKMSDAKQKLFEHFDEDVHDRLNIKSQNAREALDRVGERFWKLAHWGLADTAEFHENNLELHLPMSPSPEIPSGLYRLISAARTDDQYHDPEAHLLRLSSPLGEWLTHTAKHTPLDKLGIRLDVTNHPRKISSLDPLIGKSGWIAYEKLTFESDDTEQFSLLTAIDDAGSNIDQESLHRLMDVPGTRYESNHSFHENAKNRLQGDCEALVHATLAKATESSNKRMQRLQLEINQWAEDRILGAEAELEQIKRNLKASRREAEQSETMNQRQEAEQRVAQLERTQRRKRIAIFELEDEIEIKRKQLIAKIQEQASQSSTVEHIFTARWEVV